MSIIFAANAKLEAVVGGFSSGGVMLNLDGLHDVSITGSSNSAIKMLKAEYTSGEWRHCIDIRSSTNVTISGIKLLDSGGDGIYMGVNSSASPNNNISITNVTCDKNARQGISIISASNVTIDNCTFSNTGVNNNSGLASAGPWAGIDLEPNASTQVLNGITIKNSNFFGNRWGILYALGCNTNNIIINNNNIYDNNMDPVFSAGIVFVGPQRGTTGSFSITNNNIYGAHKHGIEFVNWNYTSALIAMDNNSITADITTENPIFFYFDGTSSYYGGVTATNTFFNNVGIKDHVIFVGGNSTSKYKQVNISGTTDGIYFNRRYNYYYENVSVTIRKTNQGVVFLSQFFANTEQLGGGLPKDAFFTNVQAKIYPGDYNGDGKTDLFVKGYGLWRGLFLANADGSGHFTMAFGGETDGLGGTDSEAFLTDPSAIVYPGDYNGDGKTDLFVKGYGTWRELYISNGTTFTRVFGSDADGIGGTDSEPFLTHPTALVYPGDYNGDGKTDLFVKGFGTWRELYISNGTTFTRVFGGTNADGEGGTDSDAFLTDPSAKVYTGDYNGDGKTDLFVKGYSTWRGLYLSNSTGISFNLAFGSYTNSPGGIDNIPAVTDPAALIFTGDFKGSGKTGLLIKGYGTYRLSYAPAVVVPRPAKNCEQIYTYVIPFSEFDLSREKSTPK